MPSSKIFWGLLLSLAAAACSAEKQDAPEAERADDVAPAPAATGNIIEVKMITDDKGNYYEPAAIHAETGDVLRFTIVSGVHNVNFLPDSNAGKQGLPPASELLQRMDDARKEFSDDDAERHAQCDPEGEVPLEDVHCGRILL